MQGNILLSFFIVFDSAREWTATEQQRCLQLMSLQLQERLSHGDETHIAICQIDCLFAHGFFAPELAFPRLLTYS
jgi:hypothetical protein